MRTIQFIFCVTGKMNVYFNIKWNCSIILSFSWKRSVLILTSYFLFYVALLKKVCYYYWCKFLACKTPLQAQN